MRVAADGGGRHRAHRNIGGAKSQRAIGILAPSTAGFEPEDVPEKPRPAERPKLFYLRANESFDRALKYAAEPLIEGVIDVGAMSVIYGESNSGKSFTEMRTW